MRLSIIKYILTALAMVIFASTSSYAQTTAKDSTLLVVSADTLGDNRVDSLRQNIVNQLDTQANNNPVPDQVSKPVADTIQTISDTTQQDSSKPKKIYTEYIDTTYYPPLDSQGVILDSFLVKELDSLLSLYKVEAPRRKDLRAIDRAEAKAIKDSIRLNTPRILETFALPDSLYYKRLVHWTHTRDFNDIEVQKFDTSYNFHFTEYPFQKEDVDATYLGVAGSPVLYHNYFKRERLDIFPAFDPYISYSYTPDTHPMYNVKTPYTELAYWGTLFAGKLKEEDNIKIMTTQNLYPSLNFNLLYERFGGGGMLMREKSDNRTFSATINNLGKKYLMNGGYIAQTVKREENGGLQDPSMILDTILDARTIPVNLSNAYNHLRRRTFFLTQSFAIPLNFFRKNADSIAAGEGTVAYLGHSTEYSTYSKVYTDDFSSNPNQKSFYQNYFINENASNDSIYTMQFDNRLFIRLQPFDNDAIISKIDGGVGYQRLSHYTFNPKYFTSGHKNSYANNLYVYAGASGMFKKYINWSANGKYYYAGYNANDFSLDGKLRLSIYPFPEGIHLTGKIHTSLRRPDWFSDNLYTNHYIWNNSFDKISESKLEGTLTIDKFDIEAFAGYALVDNMIYYDSLAIIRQHSEPMSVLSGYLKYNFHLGPVHFDNRVLYQWSSNQEVLPLPKLSLNLKYYLQFPVVKNVMTMQIGANAIFHTAYYKQAYNPALGQFYNQNSELIGGTAPYIDFFVNVQWKNACVFVKYLNGAKDWPTSDYFSAYHYIRSQPQFKFGLFWPFYIGNGN